MRRCVRGSESEQSSQDRANDGQKRDDVARSDPVASRWLAHRWRLPCSGLRTAHSERPLDRDFRCLFSGILSFQGDLRVERRRNDADRPGTPLQCSPYHECSALADHHASQKFASSSRRLRGSRKNETTTPRRLIHGAEWRGPSCTEEVAPFRPRAPVVFARRCTGPDARRPGRPRAPSSGRPRDPRRAAAFAAAGEPTPPDSGSRHANPNPQRREARNPWGWTDAR